MNLVKGQPFQLELTSSTTEGKRITLDAYLTSIEEANQLIQALNALKSMLVSTNDED